MRYFYFYDSQLKYEGFRVRFSVPGTIRFRKSAKNRLPVTLTSHYKSHGTALNNTVYCCIVHTESISSRYKRKGERRLPVSGNVEKSLFSSWKSTFSGAVLYWLMILEKHIKKKSQTKYLITKWYVDIEVREWQGVAVAFLTVGHWWKILSQNSKGAR